MESTLSPQNGLSPPAPIHPFPKCAPRGPHPAAGLGARPAAAHLSVQGQGRGGSQIGSEWLASPASPCACSKLVSSASTGSQSRAATATQEDRFWGRAQPDTARNTHGLQVAALIAN